MTIEKLMKLGRSEVDKYNKEPSAALLLLEHVTNLESPKLYAKLSETVSRDIKNNYIELLKLYTVSNIPVQYIMGYSYFYGYKFIVNNNVLIPRYETEELVENILYKYDELFSNKKIKVCDIGTGSGCIGISLAKEEENMDVYISDISQDALEVAKNNASNLNAKVSIFKGDMLVPYKGMKFDILVSNPPYIPDEEEVMSLVKDNEPNLALFGGEDGLKFYRIILENCHSLLNDEALICFEHAYNKAAEIKELALKNFKNAKVETLKDMQGLDRMTFIHIKGAKLV